MTQDVIKSEENRSKENCYPDNRYVDVVNSLFSMTTRDGVRLDADVYRPVDARGRSPEALPVLLMRQPYGRAIASTVVYAHPRWYARQGYIVVIQDTRGRGSSEGDFRLFETEANDGEDAVHWAAKLAGSSGAVGMYGFSYQGMTQLYAASRHPEPLKAICPAMLAYDLYSDWAYEGGAFCLQPGLVWALQLAAETARRAGDEAAYLELSAATRNLPIHGLVPSQPEVLQRLAPDSFYHDWVGQSDPEDDYWRSLIPNLSDVDLPMLHIGGWFDFYLRGTLNLYQQVTRTESPLRMQSPQHLWIGPWAHLPWNRKVGAIDFGPEAASPIDQLQVRWFDQFLKGVDTGILEQAPVSLFDLGTNQWRALQSWPSSSPEHAESQESEVQRVEARSSEFHSIEYGLISNGLAGLRLDDGQLIPMAQLAASNRGSEDKALEPPSDTLVHDPWRPVPALGGHVAIPSGPFDRSGLEGRSDILTYTTEPLTEDLYLTGDMSLSITCQADAPSFDLCAVLSIVQPQGVFNFSQGYRRMTQPAYQYQTITLALQPTCICIKKGRSLRLSLSAACFPAFAVNPGTGDNPNNAKAITNRIITLQFELGEDTRLVMGTVKGEH